MMGFHCFQTYYIDVNSDYSNITDSVHLRGKCELVKVLLL